MKKITFFLFAITTMFVFLNNDNCWLCQQPDITSTPLTEAAVGVGFFYQPTATGKEPISWSIANMPTGMIMDGSSGGIWWTPAPENIGVHEIDLQATNECGNTDQKFTITVK
jgi:hypothetical protein